MASNGGNRKRNQKLKASSHQKNSQGENQNSKLREQGGQHQWQQAMNQPKQSAKAHIQQQTKQQQQMLQQQQHQIQQQQQQQQQLHQQLQQPQQQKQQQQQQQQQQHQFQQPQASSMFSKATLKTKNHDTARRFNNKTVQGTINNLTLHAAIFWRRLDLVESLLQNGSTSWEVDQQGNTAFMIACKVGDFKLMSTLWDSACSKLNIHHCNKEGDTALHVCAAAGQEECCRFLITRNAKVDAKNKTKDTPLHLAAKSDHIGICNMLLGSAMTSSYDSLDAHRLILDENDKGQTAICVSILHQHAQITRMLLDTLTPKEQAIYLSNLLQRALNETQPAVFDVSGSTIPASQEVFLHGLLVSLSVLLICFVERSKQDCAESHCAPETRLDQCLSNTNIVQILVVIASNRYINKQIVPICCFLLIYLMGGVAEHSEIHDYDDKMSPGENNAAPTGSKFLEQFLKCNGPNDLLLKMNRNMEMSDSHDSVITIAVALTVVSLIRSSIGRSWLESNRCHLTFLKEILLQNRSILALLITTCPLLTISYLESICGEFVKLVEVLEARDREQNLAELLWEEERDRKRRERKKQKQQQKKQNSAKEAKNKNSQLQPLQIIEVSSDEELCYPVTNILGGKTEPLLDNKVVVIEHDKASTNLKSHSPQCHTNDEQCRDTAYNNLEDDSLSTGSESRYTDSGNGKSCCPPVSNEATPEAIRKDGKTNSGNAKNEMAPAEKCHDKDGNGALSTMMRWADVAKLGCAVSDKCSGSLGNHAFAQSGVYSDKNGFCSWPVSDTGKDEYVEIGENSIMLNGADMDTSESINFENTACYNDADQCPIADNNSDEETSSSSSSSIESHSHNLLSSSVLHNQNFTWKPDIKSNRGAQVGGIAAPKNTTEDQGKSIAHQPSPSRGRRKRRKSKHSQKADQVKAAIHCWSPLKDTSIVYVSQDVIKCKDNSIKTSDAIKQFSVSGDSLVLKTRPDNVLNPSLKSADKAHLSECDKIIEPSISSLIGNPKRKDIATTSIFRSEVPAVLPPLKTTRDLNPCTTGTSICRTEDTKHPDELMKEGVKSQFAKIVSCNRQPISYKPLTNIKNGEILSCKTNTGGIQTLFGANSSNQTNSGQIPVITCQSMSTLAVSSSVTQSLLSTLTMSGQFTPPPPGFQAIKEPVSVQTVRDILNLDKTIQSYNKIHNNDGNTMVPSSGKKGRIITTVLLDKVKNPPVSLQQQNKVPLLSTLAWNCGQESKVSWSKMLQSKPTTAVTGSLLDKTTTRAIFTTTTGENSFATKLPSETLGSSIVREKGKINQQNNMNLVGRCTAMTGNSFQTSTTFSTILMNRMQQRNHNRDSYTNFGIPDAKQINNKINQTTSAVQDLVTSSFLSVGLASLNSYNIASQQYQSANARSSQQILHNNYDNHMHRTCDKIDNVSSEAQSSTNKAEKESMEVKNSSLNSQPIGARQLGQNNSDGRCISPPVFFPEQIRDQTGSTNVSGASFPAFHEVHTSDFLSEMFSDPLFTDNIAVNQIRQKIQSSQCNTSHSDFSLQTSDWCDVDLDYYASLYQMKFRDVLGNRPGQNRYQLRSDRQNNLTISQGLIRHDGREWLGNHSLCGSHSLPNNQTDALQSRKHSLRWHRSIQKILDLLWTTRKQFGNIILPHPIPEYSIGMAGNVLIGIGFLIDGTQIAVLIVDKSLVQISPRIVEIMSNPEMDRHCLTRCKSFSESSNVQYIAMDLYEYNLCEYLQVCLTTCNQNTGAALYIGLVWQLLQALGFLHHKLGVPHGYLAPCWIFINSDGHLRLAGLGITTPTGDGNNQRGRPDMINSQGFEYRTTFWGSSEDLINERSKSSFFSDIRAAGKLAYFILTKGQHLFGAVAPMESEMSVMRDHLSSEAFDLISPMLTSDPKCQPTVDQCLKHPIFWSGDKQFRLILIVGSDVLTEMRTGIALTGTGAPTMMEILSLIDINMVSPNWIHEVDSTVLKEMKSFRVYKNNLAELTLFVYNCCLHFDKLSNSAKEVLDDPCKYFQNLFPSLFIAIYRSLRSSDRTDRTCYKPFF